ncbi:Alpha/Beta hydrolase protein [Mariannaea sp. PMI_226]|nr:Alpha/Beta hydrolase protein [Mariannaea sp. PMI_226]
MQPSILLAFFAAAEAIVLPSPSNKFPVAMQIQALTDNSRIDPYSPKNDRHKRKLVTSVFWPMEDQHSCSTKNVPYMTPETAEFYGAQAASMGLSNDTFSNLQLKVCNPVKKDLCNSKLRYPLAVFSSGSGISRLLYSAMAKSVASQGYVVVTVDHPYDADIVEFPDGTIIRSADIPTETGPLEKLVKVRAADIKFVIAQLQGASGRLKGFPGMIDFDRVIVYGHSIGGASAAAVLLTDSHIRGGVDLDGGLFNPALSQGLSSPFFLLGRPNHTSEDATWGQFWKNLRGPKFEAQIAGTVHGSYTDMPLVISALGLPDNVKSAIAPEFGTIDGERMNEVLTYTLTSYFASIFSRSPAAFQKAVKKVSEVSILKSKL